ncbi:hypothetical protein DPMN_068782 [Dreissena polymorpha]|uniref:Uncharacterized protein n=1 Tax=Dreissena polymorpha TaxID=45954 RepID=A0A9D3YXU7_DREPO|nr:hypothetical protein DPMN_068782 [Dreissena polymorpha]
MCFLGVVCLICESRICRESRVASEADHRTNASDETTNKYHNLNLVDGTERISQQFATHTNETEERIQDIYNTLLGNDLVCLRFANVAVLLTTLGLLYALGGALLGFAFLLKPQGHQWCIKQRATAWV